MTNLKTEFLKTIISRGYLHQCTDLDGLDAYGTTQKIVGYIGFDCTADSLHVGSLVPIMLLRHLQKNGHKPIVLLGGGTTRVGDPSGKDAARKLIGDPEIASNMEGIRRVFEKFLVFGDGVTDAVMVNNAEWLDSLNYLDFLRDYGRHFSVNRMLSFDSVKLQWGNIINGVDLGRRALNRGLFGLTSPLLETASGEKMGKTAKGAVWLNEEKLSTYDYWQYWRNVDDADVGKFLRLFTELPANEINRLEVLEGSEINEAKIVLADAATELCRGKESAVSAKKTATETFQQGKVGNDLPMFEFSKTDLANGVSIIEIFQLTGLANTNGEVRRLIRGGGARVNDVSVSSEKGQLTLNDLGENGVIKLSSGKKRHVVLKLI